MIQKSHLLQQDSHFSCFFAPVIMPIKSPLSPVHIPTDMTIWQLVEARAAKYVDRVAYTEWPTGKSLTYGQFLTEVNTVADALWNLGIRKGDVVLIFSMNAIQTPVVNYALFKIGAVMTACNPLYKTNEVLNHIRECDAKAIVTSPYQIPTVRQVRSVYDGSFIAITYGEGEEGFIPYSQLVNYEGEPAPFVPIDPKESLACLYFSSGTTGKPKGVMHSHTTMVAFIQLFDHPAVRFSQDDRSESFVAFVPYYHLYGGHLMHTFLIAGKTTVIMQRFDLEAYLQLNVELKCSILFTVPPVATLLVKHPKAAEADLSHVRAIVCGAAPLGKEVEKAILARFNITGIKQAYGMTEGVSNVTPNYLCKSGSVGVLLPQYEAKIVSTISGEEIGPNEEGEIITKGPNMMLGYINRPDATSETIDEDGWLHTGDIGHYDDDGFFYVVDRKKELIKYKGMQVAPASLEDLLLGHEAIQDVAVIGIPDEMAGELPKAFIVKKPNHTLTEKEICDYVAERVAPFKKIRGGVSFVESIPKSPSGKILRRLLRDGAK